MKKNVSLDYTLGEGWLSPWLDGLRKGKAMASSCSGCQDVYFPPLKVCPTCFAPCDGWRSLSGGAVIVHRTTGSDGDFAMARFDGAKGAAIANAEALPSGVTRAVLAPSPEDPPTLALIPEPLT